MCTSLFSSSSSRDLQLQVYVCIYGVKINAFFIFEKKVCGPCLCHALYLAWFDQYQDPRAHLQV